jgi:hypothetical protein
MNGLIEPHKNENPLAGGFPSATAKKHETNVNATDAERKRFETLRARFAIAGHCLHRTQPSDGAVTLFATRWGLVRELPTIEDAEKFLAQIGGGK